MGSDRRDHRSVNRGKLPGDAAASYDRPGMGQTKRTRKRPAEVAEAVEQLFRNLSPRVPEGLVSQFLPAQWLRVRAGELEATPRELAVARVEDVMELYLRAGEPPGADER